MVERKFYIINENAAKMSHSMMSMRDYVAGSKTVEYRQLVNATYDIADKIAMVKPKEAERAYNLADKFSRKLAENFNQASRIGCMCPSILISGGSNFPVKKKEKQNKASDKNMQEYNYIMGIRNKLVNILYGREMIKSSDEDAIEKLHQKLEDLQEKQEKMKAINAYYRKHKTLDGCPELTKEGINQMKAEMAEHWHYEDKPYDTYMLTNNNQNIKRVRDRLKQLEATKEKGSIEQEKEFFKVVENVEIMRLQLFFDEKPEENVRDVLKSNGFKWSPKNICWQRQLTNNAKYALHRVIQKLKELNEEKSNQIAD